MQRHDLYKRGRSCPVTCLSFGPDRKEEYPQYFFCHGCDLLEDAVVNNMKRANPNRQMKKYLCTGGHSDITHPTTLKSQYRCPKTTTQQSIIGGQSGDENILAAFGGNIARKDETRKSPPAASSSMSKSPKSTPSPTKKKQRRRSHTPSTTLLWDAPALESAEKQGSGIDNSEEVQRPRPLLNRRNHYRSKKMQQPRIGQRGGDDEFAAFVSRKNKKSEDARTPGKSPSTSPTKKKQRQQTLRWDPALESSDNGCSDDEGEVLVHRLFPRNPSRSPRSGGDKRGKNAAASPSTSRQISNHVSTTACVTPAGGNEDRDTMYEKEKYRAGLEEKNARLNERVIELNQSRVELVVKIEALSAEIEQLRGVHDINYTARTSIEEEYDVEEGKGQGMCHKESFKTTRKHRIQVENTKLASELSMLINDFVTSSRFADRRKFPSSRLAKIVIESILSFEWTHSEIEKVYSNSTNGNDALSTLSALLNIKRCRRNKNKAATIVDCMWDNDFLDGEAQRYMIERVRTYLRRHVFTPWKILKAMDVAGFNLSLAGLEVLRRVEATGKYARGIIPSKSTLLRSARLVEASAKDYCPFSMIGQAFCGGEEKNLNNNNDDDGNDDNNIGEGFEFDAIKVTATLFEAFGLMNEARRRPVELALTSDGAQLTNTLSHVAAGLKFNDIAMCHPITKAPLLLHAPDSLVQSRNLCFPLRIVIGKDNKTTLDGFRRLYNQFNTGEVATALDCQSFRMSFPGDMKLQWGALDNGGAAKVKEQFCYICPCRSSTLHVPQDKTTCHLCKSKAPDNEDMCYHYPFMADPEVRGELAEELHLLNALVQDAIKNMDAENEHPMYVRRPGEVMIGSDHLDIDFQPSHANDKAVWAGHITRELASRSLPVTGTLFERQQRLRSHLVNEQRSRDVTHMLADSEPKDQAMYLVLQAVVCILHLENRIGLKSIESILRSGISNARRGTLDWISGNGVNRRQEEYVNRITSIMQTQILGTSMAPSQWRFPLTEEGNMGTLSMDNNRTRAVMNLIELIIKESFPTADTNKDLLLRCFPRYREAIIILRKNTDATEEEIAIFQDHIDAWFRDWVTVYGKEGCTNYTHMLSSSHVMRYMQEWKCLHRFSQQGWEALNALIKSYFFRRTNRGGLSKNSTKKSKLLGIARWLQRRIMWYSGHGDMLFVDDSDDSSYAIDNEDDSISSSTDLDETFESASEHSEGSDNEI